METLWLQGVSIENDSSTLQQRCTNTTRKLFTFEKILFYRFFPLLTLTLLDLPLCQIYRFYLSGKLFIIVMKCE